MIFDNIKLQISNFKLNVFGILNFQVGNIESKFLSAISVALYTFITNYVAILATERKEYNYKCSQCTIVPSCESNRNNVFTLEHQLWSSQALPDSELVYQTSWYSNVSSQIYTRQKCDTRAETREDSFSARKIYFHSEVVEVSNKVTAI